MHENITPEPPRRGRRTLVLPAVAAALAIGLAGGGVGFAAARHDQAPASASTSTTPQSPSSTVVLPPGYSYGYGDGYDYGSGDGFGYGQDSTDTTGQASGDQLTGLVRIVSTMKYDGAEAAGTGMVLTSDGEVVTNHHVVEGATSVKVTVMSTGQTYTATVVGTDPTADVAVLQLRGASGLDTVSTDTDGVTRGDAVTAVGDGNGTVSYLSAATGQVIATDQSITTQSEGTAEGESLTGLIEISSDVVGGYSGGATYDADGQVVGMTTAASSGGDVVGYAIPISKVLTIADDLESGVQDTAYSYGYPAFLGIGLGNGTVVQGVYDGTPAADAGISAGDTITEVDGTSVTTADQLHSLIAAHSPGDGVRLTWTDSSGSSHSATITLDQGPVA
jgi:S1-C subfamily serine protease